MQIGRHIHHPRNTVIGPLPSQRNRDRRIRNIDAGKVVTKGVEMKPKMVANAICVWCSADQKGFRVICRRCKTCQYCGMFCGRHDDWCRFCGNKPMADDIEKPRRHRILAGRPTKSPQKPPKRKKRSVRRSGPLRRDKRHGGLLGS